MLFNSLQFLFFFPLIVGSYYLLSHRFRWILLLLASYYFYMAWKPLYVSLLLFSTLVDYSCGLKMSSLPQKKDRKPYLYLSLCSNLSILFFFKYFGFFGESLQFLTYLLGMNYAFSVFELLLPLGISFYTFQTMAYSIDVYNGTLKAEKHLGIFALFVSFFPQLVAGPIERASRLLPQFRKEMVFDYQGVRSGLLLMAWGFFKKVVIADRLGVVVSAVYAEPTAYEPLVLALANVFFAFQVYCDFSGYSDIAIGAARVLGFDLMTNFRRPFFATSVKEFWERWHISLSTWFRDYFYIPLGGNRVVKWRWYYNLFVTFAISGLWHGAAWTYVVWGMVHGGLFLLYIWFQASIQRLYQKRFWLEHPLFGKIAGIVVTQGLIFWTWSIFRANTLQEGFWIYAQICSKKLLIQIYTLFHAIAAFGLQMISYQTFTGILHQIIPFSIAEIATLLFLVMGLMWAEFLDSIKPVKTWLPLQPMYVRWMLYGALLWAIFLMGNFKEQEFIYFNF